MYFPVSKRDMICNIHVAYLLTLVPVILLPVFVLCLYIFIIKAAYVLLFLTFGITPQYNLSYSASYYSV